MKIDFFSFFFLFLSSFSFVVANDTNFDDNSERRFDLNVFTNDNNSSRDSNNFFDVNNSVNDYNFALDVNALPNNISDLNYFVDSNFCRFLFDSNASVDVNSFSDYNLAFGFNKSDANFLLYPGFFDMNSFYCFFYFKRFFDANAFFDLNDFFNDSNFLDFNFAFDVNVFQDFNRVSDLNFPFDVNDNYNFDTNATLDFNLGVVDSNIYFDVNVIDSNVSSSGFLSDFLNGVASLFSRLGDFIGLNKLFSGFTEMVFPEDKNFELREREVEINGQKVKCFGAACDSLPKEVK